MTTIQVDRKHFVNAMLTLRTPHPALYPFLSVFAAVWDYTCNAQTAWGKANSLSADLGCIKAAEYGSPADRYAIELAPNPQCFILHIQLPTYDGNYLKTAFETDGINYLINYEGDTFDHLPNELPPPY